MASRTSLLTRDEGWIRGIFKAPSLGGRTHFSLHIIFRLQRADGFLHDARTICYANDLQYFGTP